MNKQTRLAEDLKETDKFIYVEDASNFDAPNPTANKPGVIEIRGERIEYFTLNGNVLGQLRRGTLGTGVPKLHKVGSYVQDIGTSETIMYSDVVTTQQIVSKGSNTISGLNFVPEKSDDKWSYSSGFTSSIPSGYGQSNDIEVFVGGYNISPWVPATSDYPGKEYTQGDLIEYNGYNYKCKSNHTSSDSFANDLKYWNFFVANIRLHKKPYSMFNLNIAPNSPAGDVQFDSDFSVDGSTNAIRLTNPVNSNVLVTVVKRTGKDWDSTVNIIDDISQIALFLKATPGVWYTGIENYNVSKG